jgi:hypothetical protein
LAAEGPAQGLGAAQALPQQHHQQQQQQQQEVEEDIFRASWDYAEGGWLPKAILRAQGHWCCLR